MMNVRRRAAPPAEPWSEADFQPVEAFLTEAQRGATALSPQRLSLIRARLQVRLEAMGVPSFTWFFEQEVAPHPTGAGRQLLVDLTTINHSTFFRELVPLRAVAEHVANQIKQRQPGTEPIRVWSAGCAAGQEPYSFAMLLAELVPNLGREQLDVVASDIALGMVRLGARAVYEARELADVPEERLRRYFLRGREGKKGLYRVAPEVRALVTFQHFDLRRPDWPVPAFLDAILWRNVAIYFDEIDRMELFDRFAGRLREGGWLVVGNCEILPERPTMRKIAPSIFRRVAAP